MNYSDFEKRMATDMAFAKKFSGCSSVKELIKKAAAEGYHFTEEDVTSETDITGEEIEDCVGGIDSMGFSVIYDHRYIVNQ